MIKRLLIAGLVCVPMAFAIADDVPPVPQVPPVPPVAQVPPVPPVPPVPELAPLESNEDIVIRNLDEDGERTITIIREDGKNNRDVQVIRVESIGDRIASIAERVGEWAGEIGESVGRSFDDNWNGRTDYAKSEFGNAREIELIKDFPSDGRVSIENISGSVEITGWERNEVKVSGRLGEDVERLTFDVDGDEVRIKVVVPKGRNRKIKSELIIRVPHQSGLEVETVSAPIIVKRVEADSHRFETISGRIELYNTKGEIDAESVSGSIEIEDAISDIRAESISGRILIQGDAESIHAESVSGRIELHGVRRGVEAESISGRIEIHAKGLEEIEAETVSGGVSFVGNLAEGAEVNVNALSGSVNFDIGHPIEGTYDLRTGAGSIKCSFGPEIDNSSRRGPGRSLRFEYGDGDGDIRIETFSGSITLND